MKKFQFKLETLLSVREREEKVAQRELAIVHQELERIIGAVEVLYSEREVVEKTLKEKQQRSITIDSVIEYVEYLQLMYERIASMEDEKLRMQNVVESKRKVVMLAMQRKKALENLKERKLSQWEEEYRKMEKTFLDEVATVRYVQNKRGLADER